MFNSNRFSIVEPSWFRLSGLAVVLAFAGAACSPDPAPAPPAPVAESAPAAQSAEVAPEQPAAPPTIDDIRMAAMTESATAIAREAEGHGGWPGWETALAEFRSQWRARLDATASSPNGVIEGENGFLFRPGWEEYLLQTDYVVRPGTPPTPSRAISALTGLNEQLLSRGIHFIVVPLPERSEIYPETFLDAPRPALPIMPQRKQFIEALLANGVEAIDLLPAFEAVRDQRHVSLRQDTHWSPAGVEVAAEVLAARLSRYDLRAMYGRAPGVFQAEAVPIAASWDLYARLDPTRQGEVPVETVSAMGVTPADGSELPRPGFAPLAVIGDTAVFYYRKEQADLAAQLTHRLGYPVAPMTIGAANAPGIARHLARVSPQNIAQLRVLVFVFSVPYARMDAWAEAALQPAG